MDRVEKDEKDLRVGDISELLILAVLCALVAAPLSKLFESLEVATEDSKAPFTVGPSLEEVLKWRERLNEVQEERSGNLKIYRVTEEGKETVTRYGPFLRKLFPNIAKIGTGENAAQQYQA